jgi:G patch domain/KOW motif-containing protein
VKEQPLLVKNRIPGIEKIEDEEDRFRFDVSCRPNEANAQDYERMPVLEYGAALLRGMGWTPGDPIGLTNKWYY